MQSLKRQREGEDSSLYGTKALPATRRRFSLDSNLVSSSRRSRSLKMNNQSRMNRRECSLDGIGDLVIDESFWLIVEYVNKMGDYVLIKDNELAEDCAIREELHTGKPIRVFQKDDTFKEARIVTISSDKKFLDIALKSYLENPASVPANYIASKKPSLSIRESHHLTMDALRPSPQNMNFSKLKPSETVPSRSAAGKENCVSSTSAKKLSPPKRCPTVKRLVKSPVNSKPAPLETKPVKNTYAPKKSPSGTKPVKSVYEPKPGPSGIKPAKSVYEPKPGPSGIKPAKSVYEPKPGPSGIKPAKSTKPVRKSAAKRSQSSSPELMDVCMQDPRESDDDVSTSFSDEFGPYVSSGSDYEEELNKMNKSMSKPMKVVGGNKTKKTCRNSVYTYGNPNRSSINAANNRDSVRSAAMRMSNVLPMTFDQQTQTDFENEEDDDDDDDRSTKVLKSQVEFLLKKVYYLEEERRTGRRIYPRNRFALRQFNNAENNRGFESDSDLVEIINSKKVAIGIGRTLMSRFVYEQLEWTNHSTTTRKLLMAVFTRRILASHSLTGKSSPAFAHKPAKMRLCPQKIADIVMLVTRKCGVTETQVRNTITTKCSDEHKMEKLKMEKKIKNNIQVDTPEDTDSDNLPPIN